MAVLHGFPYRRGWTKGFWQGLRVDGESDVEPVLALSAWLMALLPPALLGMSVTALTTALMQDVPPWMDVPLVFFLGLMILAVGGFLAHGAVYVFGGARATLLSDSMALLTASAAISFILVSS